MQPVDTSRLGVGTAVLGAGAVAALAAIFLPPLIAIPLFATFAVMALLNRTLELRGLAEALLLATAFVQPMNRLGLGPLEIGDYLLLLAVGVYFLLRLQDHRRYPPTYRVVVIALVILAIGGFVGALFEPAGPFLYTPDRRIEYFDISGFAANMLNLRNMVIGSLTPMALFILARPSRALFRLVVVAFVAGCVVSAIAGFAVPSLGVEGLGRLQGLTLHTRMFGTLSQLGIGAAAGLLLSARRPSPVLIGTIPLLAMAVVMSGSRAAFASLVPFLLGLGPLARSRVVMGVTLLSVVAGVAFLAVGIAVPEGDSAIARIVHSDSASATDSDDLREEVTSATFDRFLERPITGSGWNYMRPSHNVFLGIIASAGVLGVIGTTMLVGHLALRVWATRRDRLVVGLGLGYFVYLAAAYYDNLFWWRWLWFYVAMLVWATWLADHPDDRGLAAPVGRAHSARTVGAAGVQSALGSRSTK